MMVLVREVRQMQSEMVKLRFEQSRRQIERSRKVIPGGSEQQIGGWLDRSADHGAYRACGPPVSWGTLLFATSPGSLVLR